MQRYGTNEYKSFQEIQDQHKKIRDYSTHHGVWHDEETCDICFLILLVERSGLYAAKAKR